MCTREKYRVLVPEVIDEKIKCKQRSKEVQIEMNYLPFYESNQ